MKFGENFSLISVFNVVVVVSLRQSNTLTFWQQTSLCLGQLLYARKFSLAELPSTSCPPLLAPPVSPRKPYTNVNYLGICGCFFAIKCVIFFWINEHSNIQHLRVHHISFSKKLWSTSKGTVYGLWLVSLIFQNNNYLLFSNENTLLCVSFPHTVFFFTLMRLCGYSGGGGRLGRRERSEPKKTLFVR